VEWGVKNLWTKNARILMAAEQKVGKTFFVCSIAVSVSAGIPLFGVDRFQVMDPGCVMIVAGEDEPAELGRRLSRMFRANGLLMSDCPVIVVAGHNIRLDREHDQTMMRKMVRRDKVRLLIYDPLARLMCGDENSKEVVSGVMNPAGKMASEEGISVMFVHHLGKQGDIPKTAINRVRGSSDIASWFSCGMFISGNMKQKRLNMEVIQRTSGDIPGDFPVFVKEEKSEDENTLGRIRLVAELGEQLSDSAGPNEVTIVEAADKILELVQVKGPLGLTLPEVYVHLGYGKSIVSCALKRLIREERVLKYEEDEDLHERKILVINPDHPISKQTEPDPDPPPIRPVGGQTSIIN
jgi:hypothetical protein